MTASARVDQAVEAACSFLLSRRGPDGLWREFELVRGTSDEWVSAYIGVALASVARSPQPEIPKSAIAQSIVEILSARRSGSEGWGYRADTPPDADSTAWVTRLAYIAGDVDAYGRGIRFLKRCLHSNGGVATYDSPVAIRRFLGEPPISLRGWCSPHVCVTAAAAWLPDIARYLPVRDFLRNAQLPAGNWQAYWWSGSGYATALAVEALGQWGHPEDLARVARAAQWAESAAEEDSPFGIACRLAVLQESDVSAARSFAARLVDLQQPDGSWLSSAPLRLPPPQVTDPACVSEWISEGKGFSSVNLDHGRLYTTATALRALRPLHPRA